MGREDGFVQASVQVYYSVLLDIGNRSTRAKIWSMSGDLRRLFERNSVDR